MKRLLLVVALVCILLAGFALAKHQAILNNHHHQMSSGRTESDGAAGYVPPESGSISSTPTPLCPKSIDPGSVGVRPYHNGEFGFSLYFDPTWDDFQVTTNTVPRFPNIIALNFLRQGTENLFTIIVAPADKSSLSYFSPSAGPYPLYLDRSTRFLYGYYLSNAPIEPTYTCHVHRVLATFRLE